MSTDINLNSDIWARCSDVYVRGHAFYDEEYKNSEELASLVEDTKSLGELSSLLSSLNGIFSIVVDTNKKTILAADRMRTGPMFYSKIDGGLQVSDDCSWIMEKTPDLSRSEVSEIEYKTSRFVTGSHTLYEEISQLQSGEIVVFEKATEDYSVHQHHVHTISDSQYGESELKSEFQRVLDSVFNRLVEAANGRTIVVPLSGGYDSRLIALMLNRVDYEDVITYTIDTGGDTTSIAKQVADNLGFPWISAEETHTEWNKFYNSEEWDEFLDSAAYLGGLPNPTGIHSMKELKKSGEIPEDALFVPGHSALDSMKATPKKLEKESEIRLKQLTEYIINQHFKYNQRIEIPSRELSARVAKSIGLDTQYEPRSPLEAFERWRLKERRAKLIINSRVYDYLGWERWIPLEDNELYEFWRNVPLKYKRHRSFYERYIEKLYAEVDGVNPEEASRVANEEIISMVGRQLRNLPIWPSIRQLYNTYDNSWLKYEYMKRFRLDEVYESDCRFGIMSKETFREHYEGQSFPFFSILARSVTEEIKL